MDLEWMVANRNKLIAWQNQRYWRPANGEIRLNVGSGHLHWPGYVNIDKYTPEADTHDDARHLSYADNSVDEISSHHVLEHLPQRHLVSTLREWVRVLKPGGVLDLGLPDIGLTAEYFQDVPDYVRWHWLIYTIYGYQIDSALPDLEGDGVPLDEGQFHKAGITLARLRHLLEQLGCEILDSFNYDAYNSPSAWVLARKTTGLTEPRPPSVFEQECIMGTFTHRTTYLPALLDSAKRHLPHIPLLIKIQAAPINANMAALWQEFRASGKRYWLFLDDDIQFLNNRIVHDAIRDMVTHGWAMAHCYSDFDPASLTRPYPETLRLIEEPAVREVGFAAGYFMLVDSWQVGHIAPDLTLPDPNTSVDTSYSIAIRQAGGKIGLSGNVVYHVKKQTPVNPQVVVDTNAYLLNKWGQFYFDHCRYGGNVLEWPPSKYH